MTYTLLRVVAPFDAEVVQQAVVAARAAMQL